MKRIFKISKHDYKYAEMNDRGKINSIPLDCEQGNDYKCDRF